MIKNMKIGFKLFIAFGLLLLLALALIGIINLAIANSNVTNLVNQNLINNRESVVSITESSVKTSVIRYLDTVIQANLIMTNYYYNQFQQGILTEEEAKVKVENLILAQYNKIGETGYSWICSFDGAPEKIIAIVHPNIKGADVSGFEFIQTTYREKNGFTEYEWKNPGEEEYRDKVMSYAYFEPWNWSLGCGGYKDDYVNLVDFSLFEENIISLKTGQKGETFVIDNNGNVIMHEKLKNENIYNRKDINGNFYIQKIIENGKGRIEYSEKTSDGKIANRIAYYDKIQSVHWIVVSTADKDEIYADVRTQTITIAVVSIVVFLLLIPIILLVNRSITKPIKKATDILKDISEGEGDLTKRINIHNKDEIGEMASYFNKFIDNLNDMILQIKSSMEQINSGVSQISDSTQILSEGTSKQASSMEEIAATMNEFSAQLNQNVNNIKTTYSIIEQTRDNSTEGNKLMSELIDAMEKVNNSASDIKKIVNVIDDIAFQTNLLALNADIEAERVGKYGRGFAVVAGSVRTLAGRSAEAVKDTKERIEVVIKNIEKGDELVKQTALKFKDISNGAEESTTLIKDISESSEEQSNGINQINTALSSIEEVVQSNSANAEENASSSEELSALTHEVMTLINYFKVSDKDEYLDDLYNIDTSKITPEILEALEKYKQDKNRKQITSKSDNNNG